MSYNNSGYNNQGGGYGGGYNNNNNNRQPNNGGGYNSGYNQGFNNNNSNQGYNSGYNNNNSNRQAYSSVDMPGDDYSMVPVGNDDFCPEYHATTKNIQQITVAVATLTKLVQQIGTQRDSLEIRDKIRACVSSTTHLISSESSKVKTLTSLAGRARDQKTKLSYQKLVKEYNTCLQQFQEIAQIATKKERSTKLPTKQPPPQQQQQQQQYQQQSGRYGGGGYEDEREDESQSLMESDRRQQLAQIESEREYQNSIIQERDEGIRQIEQSIVEINEIFVDLSNLVSEQGVMLDTIEGSLISAEMNTGEAVVQIKQASNHQRSARTKMCWLALILFIVAGVLAVILYFTLRK